VSGRSYLFVPGNRPDRFEKARSAGADAVILDLEDAVPSEKKTEAREAVSAWLSQERPAYVRVNGTATPWFRDDLEAVARPGLAGVVLPKAEDPDEISEAASRLPEEASVLPLLETAAGVWDARALAEAPRVERLAFGSIDFRLDAGIDGRLRNSSTPARASSWPLASPASSLRSTASPPRSTTLTGSRRTLTTRAASGLVGSSASTRSRSRRSTGDSCHRKPRLSGPGGCSRRRERRGWKRSGSRER
jgi:citrate lyase beta subunit